MQGFGENQKEDNGFWGMNKIEAEICLSEKSVMEHPIQSTLKIKAILFME